MNMQTGFGDAGDKMAEQYIETMTNILLPVMEKGITLACEYSKACGRDTLLPEDVEYATKYCAMYKVGEDIGSIYPDIYEQVDNEDEEEDEEMPTVDPEDCPQFERYSGNNPIYVQINEAYDRWNSWEPQNPTERMLKNAINSNEHMGA